MQDKILYAACFGFLAGVLVRSFVPVNFYLAVFAGFLALVVLIYFNLVKYRIGAIGAVCIFAFALGILRFNLADRVVPEVSASGVTMTGQIVDEPDIRENNEKLTVQTENSKILVTVGLGQDFKYGDEIKFTGELEKPENFTTDTGKVFDYINYLRKDGIYYVMNYANIEILSRGHGNFIKSALFSFKEKFLDKVNAVIPNPENLLMAGLILGEKSSFSQALRQSFVDTGTIHIVALSGYNVTIVALWFMGFIKLFKFLPQSFGIGAGIVLIWLFVFMTGGSSTAIRAGIMATLGLIARVTGRNYDAGRALLLAGVGMILMNPFLLVYDISFELSFIATVAVIFLQPKIEKYFQWLPKSFELRDTLSVTFAAYIFVAPFILYQMGNFSLAALPANALILPFIPFTMMLGFATGFLGLVWYGLAVPIGFVSFLFLRYELLVINFFSHLPFAALATPNFPLILTLLIYAIFIYWLFGRSLKKFSNAEVL